MSRSPGNRIAVRDVETAMRTRPTLARVAVAATVVLVSGCNGRTELRGSGLVDVRVTRTGAPRQIRVSGLVSDTCSTLDRIEVEEHPTEVDLVTRVSRPDHRGCGAALTPRSRTVHLRGDLGDRRVRVNGVGVDVDPER